MSKRTLPVVLSVCVLLWPGLLAQASSLDSNLSAEERGTILDLTLVGVALAVDAGFRGSAVALPGDWVEVAALVPQLDPVFIDSIASLDRWGNPLLARQADGTVLLLSTGPNSAIDDQAALERVITEGGLYRSAFTELGGDDILVGGGEVLKGPLSVLDRWRMTAADIRTLATALHAYCIDHGSFPPLPPGLHDVEVLKQYIEPIYLRETPTLDGWEIPLKVRSEAETFLLISFGSDGVPQTPYDSVSFEHLAGRREVFADPSGDVVYLCDSFVSIPEALDASWGF